MRSTSNLSEPFAVRARDAARLLGVSERTLANWTKSGVVPSIKQDRTRLYPLAALREWIAARQEGGAQ